MGKVKGTVFSLNLRFVRQRTLLENMVAGGVEMTDPAVLEQAGKVDRLAVELQRFGPRYTNIFEEAV